MKNIFSLFFESNNSFSGEEKDEKTILLIRRHPFFVITHLILFVFLILIPIVLVSVFSVFIYKNNLFGLFLLVSGLWYLFLWTGIFYTLTMYTLDVWIVTDRRIIDSEQHGFFNRTVAELHLARIQDISVETNGFIQTIFKFGNLSVQTAGAEEKFKFFQIPNPNEVKDKIMKLTAGCSIAHL